MVRIIFGTIPNLPLIAVNAGALSELVNNKVNGFLFESGDINAIDEAICTILSQEELCKNMAKKSLEYIAKHDIKNTLESFEKVYKLHAKLNVPSVIGIARQPMENFQ